MDIVGERVLVTGATGFVGANLAARLFELGAVVHVFVRGGRSNWRLNAIANELIFHDVDLGDFYKVEEILNAINPNAIYHLATYGAYPRQKDFHQMIQTNIEGSYNLFKAACDLKELRRIVNTGSSSEYGLKSHPMREDDVLKPAIPYGIAKAAQTHLAQYFAKQFSLPITTLRLLSVYGPYEEKGRLITDLMTAYAGSTPLVLSSPKPKRDFVFVEDVVGAFLKAVEVSDTVGEVFNIGGGREYSIGEVIEIAEKMIGKPIKIQWGAEEKKRGFEPFMWLADISKAEAILGWKPTFTLEEGLKKTYEWYTKHINLYEQV